MLRAVLFFGGVFLAAVLQFAWGFAFWAVLPISSEHMIQRLPVEHEGAVVKALTDANVESGHYFYPCDPEACSGKNKEAEAAFMKKHAEGPLVQIIYHKGGMNESEMGMTFLFGFGHMLASSLLAAGLLVLAGRSLPTYLHRVVFVLLLGVFASFAITLSQPVWFHHPWKFSLLMAGFEVVGWLFAGIVLGAFVRPAKPALVQQPSATRAPHLMPEAFHPADKVRV